MTAPGSWLRSWDDTRPAPALDPWPDRESLRDALIAAGVDAVYADLLASLSQSGRPDLRDQVRERLTT